MTVHWLVVFETAPAHHGCLSMPDELAAKSIGSAFCDHYQTEAQFFVEPAKKSGDYRHLIVTYANGRQTFRAAIPHERSEKQVLALLLTAPTLHSQYPVWEHGARLFGQPKLTWLTSAPRLSDDDTKHGT